MAIFTVEPITITITDVAEVVLTCASTVGLYPGMVGNILDSSSANNSVVVIKQILTSTTFTCYFKVIPTGLTFTSYNGGKIFFDKQLVEVTGPTPVYQVN